MPYKSKAQARLFFSKEGRGELKKGTARRWAHETKGGIKSLPEKIRKRKRKRKRKMNVKSSKTFWLILAALPLIPP
jgi:hypothetical protein